jgi:GNAT superfamily N-acetyltransferase
MGLGMKEVKIVPFNPEHHMDDYIEIYHEYITWFSQQFIEHNNRDIYTEMGTTITDFVNNNLEPYISMKLPKGTLQILEVDGKVAGIGAIHKLSADTGEIKRMYNRPEYRGRGFGRLMLNKLLDIGRSVGCSRFLLDSQNFSFDAHNLYRSAGFSEVDDYPESEIPVDWRQYWKFMEMNL